MAGKRDPKSNQPTAINDPKFDKWTTEFWGNTRQMLIDLNKARVPLRQYRDYPQLIRDDPVLAQKTYVDVCDQITDFCKEQKRLYAPDQKDVNPNMEAKKEINRLQNKINDLEKDKTEALKAKDKALNRLSELQSRLLKHGNPEITDLSDENRPTNLGQHFKNLYEDEWTDAFTYLTDNRPQDRMTDEKGISTLYTLVKRCNDLCIQATANQRRHVEEALVSPSCLSLGQSKMEKSDSSGTHGPTNPQMTKPSKAAPSSKGSGQASFSKTMPYKGGSGQSNVTSIPVHSGPGNNQMDAYQTRQRQPAQQEQQQQALQQLGQQSLQHPQGQQGNGTVPVRGPNPQLEIQIKEFCKAAAPEFLKNVDIKTLMFAINNERQFPEDVLQDRDVVKFLSQCLRLCWLMQAQYPPMVMDFTTKRGDPFDADKFAVYQRRGRKVEYVVWPVIYLHKDGPVVAKGYVECSK